MFVEMCIFSGCDYLPSIPGLGIKRSHALISKQKCYKKALRCLRFEGKYKIPADYAENFEKAKLTFAHQRVYDIAKKKLVHLRELPDPLQGAQLEYMGPDIDQEIAQGIAEGKLNPVSKEVFREKSEVEPKYQKNQQVLKYIKAHKRRKNDPPPQKNNLLSFFSKKKRKVSVKTDTSNIERLNGGVDAVNKAIPSKRPVHVQANRASFNLSHFASTKVGCKSASRPALPRKKFVPEPTTDFFDEEHVGSVMGGLPEMPEKLVNELNIVPKPKTVLRRSKFFNKKRKSPARGNDGVDAQKRKKAFKPPRFVEGKTSSVLRSGTQGFCNKENELRLVCEQKGETFLKFIAQGEESSPLLSAPTFVPPKERAVTHHLRPFKPPRMLVPEKSTCLERFSCR